MFLIIVKLLSKAQLNYLIKGKIVIENKEFILILRHSKYTMAKKYSIHEGHVFGR